MIIDDAFPTKKDLLNQAGLEDDGGSKEQNDDSIYLEFKPVENVTFNDLSYYNLFVYNDEVYTKIGSYIACNLKTGKTTPMMLGQSVKRVEAT